MWVKTPKPTGDKMKMYKCGRSPTRYCNGWRGLTHEKWQISKLIAEVKLGAELLIENDEQLVAKPKSN